jgi:hypothetical protein
MPPLKTRGRTSRQQSAPCGRVVPIGGQVEPSAQLKAGRFPTIVATGSILR